MDRDEDYQAIPEVGANDDDPKPEPARITAVTLQLARLIGRQIAREQFERRRCAANDNDGRRP